MSSASFCLLMMFPALQDEASLQQQHVVHASAMAALMQGLPAGMLNMSHDNTAVIHVDPAAVTLAVKVRRGHVMEDALKHIRRCSPQVRQIQRQSATSPYIVTAESAAAAAAALSLPVCCPLCPSASCAAPSHHDHDDADVLLLVLHAGSEEAAASDILIRGWRCPRGGS